MTTTKAAGDAVRIGLSAMPGGSMMACDLLADALGVTREAAETALARGHADVTAREGLPPGCLPLLRLLGVEARLLGPAADTVVDVALRLRSGADPVKVARWLAQHCPQAQGKSLSGPSGLVLEMSAPEAASLRRRSLGRPDIDVLLTAHHGALFDIFPPGDASFHPEAKLKRYLSILGFGPHAPVAALGGALASGLDRLTMQRLMARFGHLGLLAVHQRFQRFDLVVTGPGHLTRQEMVDFLAARGTAPGPGKETVAEPWLSRKAARQFLNDYRHIGLDVAVRLVRD